MKDPGGSELPAIQPVVPEVDRKKPDLPPELIRGILDEIETNEGPFEPEKRPMHETDRPDIPDIDDVIRNRKKN